MTGKAIPSPGNGSGSHAVPPPSGLPTVGAEVEGKYRLQRLIGMGAIGQVFEAEHLLAGRRVAMRFLHPRLRGGEFERRFLAETRSVGTIGHENVAELLDVGASSDFGPYVVMELVGGETLAAVLINQGVLPLERAIDILAQVLAALDAAHARNVVCRDLRPENVMLTTRADRADFVKLLDFGLSKEGAGGPTSPYVAPEQAAGGIVDGRADVFAAGVMLYRTLANQTPEGMQGRAPAGPSTLRPELPASLDGVVLRAIATAPGSRWQSARELRDSLRSFSSRRLTRPTGYPTTGEVDPAATTDPQLRKTIMQAIPTPLPEPNVVGARMPTPAPPPAPVMAEPVAQKGKSRPPKGKSKPPTGRHLVHDPQDHAENEFFSNEAMPAMHTEDFERPAMRRGPIIAVATVAGVVFFGGLAYMIAGHGDTGHKVQKKEAIATPAPAPTPPPAPAPAPAAAPTPAVAPPAEQAATPPPAQVPAQEPTFAPVPAPAPPPPVVKETPPPTAAVPPPVAATPPPAAAVPPPVVKETPPVVKETPPTVVKPPPPAPVVKKPAPLKPPVETAKVSAPAPSPKPTAAARPKQPPVRERPAARAAPAAPAKKKSKREIITDNPY